jgi:four helix bundle protein
MKTYNFENLIVYQKALDYIDYVHELTPGFPANERFDLVSQFQRAAKSIALNIGEGEAGTTREYIAFLRIARRSVRECVVCTTIASRRNYIDNQTHDNSRKFADEISKMLSGLIAALQKKNSNRTKSQE